MGGRDDLEEGPEEDAEKSYRTADISAIVRRVVVTIGAFPERETAKDKSSANDEAR
jgi:hypothetical protein